MEFFLQLLFNGLAIGAVYALVAVGYSLVYGTLQFVNFAAGDQCMVAAYVAYGTRALLGWPWPVAIVLAIVVSAALGMVIERLAYRPLRDAPRLMPLISALGVAIVLQNVVTLFFGGKLRSLGSDLTEIPGLTIGGAILPGAELLMLGVAGLTVLVLFLTLHYTKLGLALRAVACDREAAEAVGIRADRMISITFALASGIGAVAGLLIGCVYDISPTMGILLGFKAFTACVVGGLRSLPGAIAAGVLLGVAENLAAGYISSAYKDAYAFVVLGIILVVRPQGLFSNTSGRST